MSAGDFLHGLRLFLDRRFGAIELEEEHRFFPIAGSAVPIDRAHGETAERFAAGERDSRLERADHGGDRTGQICK